MSVAPPAPTRAALFVILLTAAAHGVPPRPLDAQDARPTCESCHGELELLRQHTATMDEARSLLAPAAVLAASAHGSMTCADCHTGFRSYPHRPAAATTSCASCHEATATDWTRGVHALDSAAACTDCHGVHDVRSVEAMRSPEGTRAVQAACAACHYTSVPPEGDPHTGEVSCASCHEPHATLPAEDEHASTHVVNQGRTCGACHEEQAEAWQTDVHGTAVPALATSGVRAPEGASRAEAPACTACHGAHGIDRPAEPGFGRGMMERCSVCHEPYRDSFADSYHGQATILGSEAVATCSSCHGAHGVYPQSDPRSTISEANLLSTCQSCHPTATEGFALFQPHADHHDRENYPLVYWSYHLMTALLLGTFTVFGLHTLLWLARLSVNAIRGVPSHPDPRG